MKDFTPLRASSGLSPHHRAASCQRLALIGILAAGLAACGPADSKPTAGSDAKPSAAEAGLCDQLKPVLSATAPRAIAFTAPPPWNPTSIFPMPVRSWLPPADTLEKAGALPGDQRLATTPPFSLAETPLPAPGVSLPEPLVLPATALAWSIGPDPARVTVWIATSPAPETRGRPPAWDRPQLATDPTDAITRAFPLAAPTGLRETPPPFLRIAIPDPFEQITIAELRNPPPEIDPPVAPFTRPANPLAPAPAGK